MTDGECRGCLAFLLERDVRPRMPRARRWFHDHMMEEWSYHLDQAEQAARVLRHIERHRGDDENPYRTFTLDRLAHAVCNSR